MSKAAGSVVLQKDWLVVIADQDSKKLTKLNSVTTLIDQVANCISAIPTLILWDLTNIRVICGFVVFYNVIGCFVEILIMNKLAKITPKLNTTAEQKTETPDVNAENETLIGTTECDKNSAKVSGFSIYSRHELFVLGIVNSLLYFTVIGDNSVTRVYYLSNCLSKTVIAFAITGSAVSGILGMRFYNFLMKKYKNSMKVTKIVSFAHWPVLWLCVLSFFLPDSIYKPFKNFTDLEGDKNVFCEGRNFTWSIVLFVIGIVLARFGLWAFDISSRQVFQEQVIESERTVIASWQTSLNTIGDVAMGICLIFVDKNFHFGWHGISSAVVITFAHILFQIKYR